MMRVTTLLKRSLRVGILGERAPRHFQNDLDCTFLMNWLQNGGLEDEGLNV